MTPTILRAAILAGSLPILALFAPGLAAQEADAPEGGAAASGILPDTAADAAEADAAPASEAGDTAEAVAETAPEERAPTDFSAIVEAVSPAVVAIATRQLVEVVDLPQGMPDGLPERFREQFGDGEMPPQETRAMGSGFLISEDGHIVTNNHVIAEATDIQVVLADGSRLPAELVGSDPLTDLAVLRVEPTEEMMEDMVVVDWGDSEALQPGAWTIAVGSPFGLGGTVTVGVLSASSRDIRVGPYDEFLQTDASINVGNSGGPLFNIDGEVVGVNTAIFSPTGASVGIGFAVPSRTAETVTSVLIAEGEVRRGFIGAGLQDLTDVMARAFGLDADAEGALVGHVEPEGPAEQGGLQHGDIVVGLNGDAIAEPRDLTFAVAELQPGDEAVLRVLRAGEEQDIAVTVGTREVPQPDPVVEVDEPDRTRLGLALRPVPDALREELGLEDAGGAVIERVRPAGLGAASVLQPGDVITEAGGAPLEEPGDVAEAWAEARDGEEPLLLRVLRGPQSLFVAIEG
ncbi:Do family serine endopeptidase [soil metagenome]